MIPASITARHSICASFHFFCVLMRRPPMLPVWFHCQYTTGLGGFLGAATLLFCKKGYNRERHPGQPPGHEKG